MFYDNNYWGMGIIWWFVWLILLIWIFAVPYDIPFQRRKKNRPMDILERRFLDGEINATQYEEIKHLLGRN